jgi:hypothetical protein
MTIREIDGVEDAKNRLVTLFGGSIKARLSDDNEIEQYAKIANFLSTRDVKNALEEVSKGIWKVYNSSSIKTSTNRFSRSIIAYAQDYGFAAQDNVVFIGALEGREFAQYVRDGVLWKDTFAPSHGEFSHSFQWLAAALALGLGKGTAALYKRSAAVFSNDVLQTRGETGALEQAKQPLWSWLVDCFQPGELESQVTGDAHIFSKKYRVPNQIYGLACQKSDWFISLYMNHRKGWLKKLAERGKVLRAEAHETDELESNLLGIMSYQQRAYPAKGGWEQQEGSGNVLKKSPGTVLGRPEREIEYHGIAGTVSNKSIDTKSLIV